VTVIAIISVALAFPIFARYAVSRNRFAAFVGSAVMCYGAGILIGSFIEAPALVRQIAEGLIPLAVPMLLFPCNVRAWLRGSRRGIMAFLFACLSVFISVLVFGRVFSNLEHVELYASMLVGTYTGGTPNLMAIGVALAAPDDVFLVINAADLAIGGIYLLFLLGSGRWFFSHILEDAAERLPDEAIVDHAQHSNWTESAKSLLLSVAISGASVGSVMLFWGELKVAWIFVILTTLALLASTNQTVRSWQGGRDLGDYLILVFCVLIGTMTTIDVLMAAIGPVMGFTACVLFFAVFLHALLCRWMNVDVDTFIISSGAALFGPAFIPVIATRVKRGDAMITGMTSALLGYAVGNYLGLLVYSLLSV